MLSRNDKRASRRVRFSEQSFQNLLDIKDVFTDLGITYYIEHGLLLGLYRDGRQIRGDEHDVDVTVPKKFAYKLDDAVAILKERGIIRRAGNRSKDGYLSGISIKRNSCVVDIHVADKKDDIVYYPFYRTEEKDKHGVFVFPADLFEPLETIEWNGVEFPCPNTIYKYLESRYGYDWRVDKIANGTWTSSRDPENNACIQIWDKSKLTTLL